MRRPVPTRARKFQPAFITLKSCCAMWRATAVRSGCAAPAWTPVVFPMNRSLRTLTAALWSNLSIGRSGLIKFWSINKRRSTMKKGTLTLMMAVWLALPVYAVHAEQGMMQGQNAAKPMGLMQDMSTQMADMSKTMSTGTMPADAMKKMGDQMKQMSEMMGKMSGMMGSCPMSNTDSQMKMDEMHKQMGEMMKSGAQKEQAK